MSKNRNHFELQKLRIKDGTVNVEYREFTTNDGVNGRWDDKTLECTVHPHPDLEDRYKKLAAYAARVMGWLDFEIVVNSPELTPTEKEATNDLRHVLKRYKEAQIDRVEVIGLHLNGSADTKGCILSVMRDSDSKTSSSVNTPIIKFKREYFGIEEQLTEDVEAISDETFEYIFNGKQSQLALNLDEVAAVNLKGKKGKKKDPNQTNLVDQSAEIEDQEQQ